MAQHNDDSLGIASLKAAIRQLRSEGIQVEIDASTSGLVLTIPKLALLVNTIDGRRRIVLRVDASIVAGKVTT